MKKGLRHIDVILVECHFGSNADLMKKGLRRFCRAAFELLELFERGPDEEGIETWLYTASSHSSMFERGPDEEGIETRPQRAKFVGRTRSNADLMKKGLRLLEGPPKSLSRNVRTRT